MLRLIGSAGEIRFETRSTGAMSANNDGTTIVSPNINTNALEHLAAQLKGRDDRKDVVTHERITALIRELDAGFTSQNDGEFYDLSTMTDENGIERYPWVHAKLLSHHPSLLLPAKADVDLIIDAVTAPTEAKLAKLPRHPRAVRKHEDPVGGWAVEAQGIDFMGGYFADIIRQNFVPARSAGGFLEMLEVYAKATLRDVKFADYYTNAKVAAVVAALNDANAELGMQANFQVPVTPQNLFRGMAPGENDGLYVSQFLLKDFTQGNLPIQQVYTVENDDLVNRTKSGYLDMIHGIIAGGTNSADTPPRRVDDGRVLGSLVHKDPAYALYFNAAMILFPLAGLDALDDDGFSSSNFLDTGSPDILAMLGTVTRLALRASWSVKWNTALKVRPETYAANIETATTLDDASEIPGFNDLKDWSGRDASKRIIDEITALNQEAVGESSAFLPLQYPEGSPTHPSFPAGHSCIAGACVTILKALSATHHANGTKITWTEAAANRAAFALEEVNNTDPTKLRPKMRDEGETINGELNKLASNIGLGRDFSGVHYRADSDCGMKIGEAVGIEFLRSQTACYYPQALRGRIRMALEKFNGEIEIIKA